VCEPISIGIASAVASGVGGIMQTNAANAASREQYEQQLKIRSAKWDANRAVWNNKLVDYKGEYSSNQEAAGRAWASEQYRLNEQFQQAAFQKQDMLAQLVGAQGQLGASEQLGRTAQRLQMEQVAAYGRNNAIIAENLASARGAMMQRNEDIRRQMISENNKAWSQVAMSPVGDLAPPPPIMKGHEASIFQTLAGIGGAVVTGLGKNQAPPPGGNVNAAATPAWGYQTSGSMLKLDNNLMNSSFSSSLKMPTNWTTPQWNSNLNFGINAFGK
jgi:hypothetical protein